MMNRKKQQEQFMRNTLDVWQPLISKELSKEDAREIVRNATGFFSVLLEWDRKNKSETSNPTDTNYKEDFND